MGKLYFLIITVAVVLIITFAGFWFNKNKMEITRVCFKENCFIAEVAKTQADRTRGLMFKEGLALDGAMLFVFDIPGLYSFWMKNCLIPLDIIWLDENYKVVAISPNNQPCKGRTSPELAEGCPSINPNVLAKYVLEINAGLASKIGLVEGGYLTRKDL